MITFSPSLVTILAAATSKLDWANKLESGLGATRRLRMFRDANASAADPTATGTEFLNVGMTGAFTRTGGDITGLGVATGTTIRLAADLLTGKSVLMIEGNGNWIKFSLGLTRGRQTALGVASANLKDYDYALFDQPTTTGGIGFVNGTGIYAPVFLPSGTGPAAPALDADTIVAYQMFAYPTTDDESARSGLGVKYINVRDSDLVFDRPYIASQIGDVRVMRSAAGDGTVFGTGGDCFRFAPTLLISDKSTNANDANKPVNRIRFLAKPHGRWATFPYRDTFNINTDTLSPGPFKIELYRQGQSGLVVADVIEMYSTRVNNVPGTGKPVNARSQNVGNDNGSIFLDTKPLQPLWTCQMSLSWQSHNYKPSTFLNHLHPGVDSRSIDPQNVKNLDSWPEQWPMITGNYLLNGLMATRIAPKWSRVSGANYDTSIVDTVFVNGLNNASCSQYIGYGHEPGAPQHHVWYMSPGGARGDRGMWTHYTVAWVTTPNGNRVHGAVPYIEMQRQYCLGYHNEGCHYVTNPELGQTLDKNHVLYGLDAYNDTYYAGGSENYRPTANSIRLLTYVNAQHDTPYIDKNRHIFTNQYQRDDQHNISNAAQMAYFMNDPMGAFEARDSFNSSMLCAFNMTQGFQQGSYLQRQHAWYVKQLVETWVAANNHPNGLSSGEIELMAVRHFEQVYDAIYPYITAGASTQARALRDLGAVCQLYFNDAQTGASLEPYDSKEFYFGNVFMFAKQSGFIERMRSLSSKVSLCFDMMLTSLCKASVDFFMDGNGRNDKIRNMYLPYVVANEPSTWTWGYAPTNGQLDWIHNSDGSLGSFAGGGDSTSGGYDPQYIEGYNTQHLRAQFLWVVKYFYPEFSFPRLDAAITKVTGWYDTVEAEKIAGRPYWHNRMAMFGIPKAPAVVGKPNV